jgi:tRNA(Ile)-lysidine synthase
MLPKTRLREYRLLETSPKPPSNTVLIRPLLATSRADIEAYCQANDLETRFDESNLDTTYFRNRLRHEVLPYLSGIVPGFATRLWHLAEVVRADYQLLQEFASVAYDTLLQASYADALVFDLARWREQPLAIRRSVIRRAAFRLAHTLRDVDFDHVEQAVAVAQQGQTGAEAVLPRGLRLRVGYTTLTIAEGDALHLPPERPWLDRDDEIQVAVPGVTPLHQGWSLHVRKFARWDMKTISQNPNPLAAWMDADSLGNRPLLRVRRTGDRFRPHGMGGAQVRLSDFLINIKMPRSWRDHLPLLEAKGRIVWVIGQRLADSAIVRETTGSAVYMRLLGP